MLVLRLTAVTLMATFLSFAPVQATTVRALFNRAEQMRAQGRYAEAEPLCKEVLAIQERVLGLSRPEIIPALNALQDLYRISERGAANSSQIAGIVSNIAVCAIDRGRSGNAEPYLLRALRIHEAALANDDPTIIPLLGSYELVLRKTKRTSQAKQINARIAFLRQNRAQQ